MAMVKIGDYFKSVDDETPHPQEQPAQAQATPEPPTAPQEPEPAAAQPREAPAAPEPSEPPEPSTASPASARPITVFSPPSSSTPISAQTTHNEHDYVPTIDHAQTYQRRLNMSSRPNRLPSDAEVAAKETAEQERLAAVKEIDVKVRLPDQSQMVSKFGPQDTGKSLYDFVRHSMAEPFAGEKFVITSPSPGGKKMQNTIPDSEKILLIKNLGMVGRVLVNFSWDPSASPAARDSRAGVLKPELHNQAQEHKVEQPSDIEMPDAQPAPAPQGEKPSTRKSGTLPKWLKLPGKK